MTRLFLPSSILKNVTCDCSSATFSYIFQRRHCLFWMVSSPALSPLTQAVPSLSHPPALCSHILPIPVWSAGKRRAAAPQPFLLAPSCLLVVNSLFKEAQRTAREHRGSQGMPGPEHAPEALSAHHHHQNRRVGKSHAA